jgi:hypothetical protein
MQKMDIVEKVYDFEKQVYLYLKKYPQSEKFALATETKNTIYTLSKKLLKAGVVDKKRATLYEADIELQHLKHLIRLAHDFKYISPKAYEVCSKGLAEIGAMLGAWIKNIKS